MDLDERMKSYEKLYDTRLLERLPVIIRIDGRAFHSYTKLCQRPFDKPFHSLMVDTLISLVDEFVPLLGYTQSDEISLVFYQKGNESQLPFGGRVNKFNSVMASWATQAFCEALCLKSPYEALRGFPCFDARCWVVPTREECCNYLLWRERDAVKNSVAMAAQAEFSHKELHGKNQSDMHEMLFSKHGINWNSYSSAQKRGTWARRENYEGPNNSVRTQAKIIADMPRFDEIINKFDFIFDGKAPLVLT